MDSELIKKLVKEAVEKETTTLRVEIENLKTEQKKSSEEVEKLKTENKKLRAEIVKVDSNLDEVEQYHRKTSLILGGAFPEGKDGETPAETRETVKQVIKEKLKVDMKGDIVACHRLRNRKRVVVKFLDSDDRDAVYEAKFGQNGQQGDKITVHENLTEKRARMITLLEEMRKKREVLNYHTKNGNIMARNCATKRYSRIQPWYTEDEIKHTLNNAALKANNQSHTHTSCTPRLLPTYLMALWHAKQLTLRSMWWPQPAKIAQRGVREPQPLETDLNTLSRTLREFVMGCGCTCHMVASVTPGSKCTNWVTI